MRRTSLFLLASVAAVITLQMPASAETMVAGHITADTTWALSGSPYVMASSVTVDETATLTIEPGVVVEAASASSLNVLGVLRAVGDETNRIIFHPEEDSWLGIRFGSAASGQATGGDTRSALQYAEIHDVKTNSSQQPAVMLRGMAPTISHNLFEGSFVAIFMEGAGASVTISDNIFAFNSMGVGGQSAATVELTGNDFWMNTTGISISGGPWSINGNDIISTEDVRNGSNLPADLLVQSSGSVDATDNWWGTTDSNEIGNRIYDGEDNPSYSSVAWEPASSGPSTAWGGHVAAPTLTLRRHLIAKGSVASSDGYIGCEIGARVLVQRSQNSQWATLKTIFTDEIGTFRARLPDRTGRYRALLPFSLTGPPDGAYCEGGISVVRRHSH